MMPCAHAELIKSAKLVVLGVVTAHEQGNPKDAAMLLNSYQQEAAASGATNGQAWATLFSASTLWVAALVQLHADHHGQTTSEAINDFALAYASGAFGG
jgi:hypothetical protein